MEKYSEKFNYQNGKEDILIIKDCFFNQRSFEFKHAFDGNNIPTNTLLWIRNHTRGNDERPFIVTSDYSIQWW